MHVGQHAMKILTNLASLFSTPSVHTVGCETAYEYKQVTQRWKWEMIQAKSTITDAE